MGESHKLDPRLIDEGPRPKKWQIEAKSIWHHFGGKINWFRLKFFKKFSKNLKGELMIWRTKMQAKGPKAWFNSRIQFASNVSKLVPRNSDPGPPSKVGLSGI